MTRAEFRFRFTATGYLVVLMGACAAAFWPVYGTVDFATMVAGAILAGTTIAVLGAVWKWNSLVTLLVSIGAFLVLGVPLAVPGETLWGVVPTPSGLLDLITAVGLSWRQLVTIAVPVGSYQTLLVPAYVVTFAGAIAAVTLALRSRMPESALVPAISVYVLAIVLGSDAVATPLALTAGIAVLCVGWLAWMRRRRRVSRLISLSSSHADGMRRGERSLAATRSVTVAAIGIAAALVVSAGVATYALPAGAARTVARTAATPPFNPNDYPSPLSGFRSYLEPARANTALFTVSSLGSVRRLRIATMDAYNGIVYSVGTQPGDSGAFARIPDTLTQPRTSDTQRMSITIDGLSGPWLPTFGALERIGFTGTENSLRAGFYYNANTETMADVSALTGGDTYEVTAAVTPTRTLSQLATEEPGSATLPPITNGPTKIEDTVQRYVGSATTPGAKLSAALKQLAQTGYISHGIGSQVKSLSGHGADRIDALLSDSPMVGDQEQYAVTAALMARQLGFPARVVLGFTAPQNAGNGPVTFTGSDVSAWIQVQTARDGWVDVDPNPQVRPIPQKKPDQPKQISRPQSVVQPPKDDPQPDRNPPPKAHVAKQQIDHTPAWVGILLLALRVLGWTAVVGALVLSPFLAVIAAKWRRRRGRRSPRVLPRGRIAGAWHEFADAALDHGYSPHIYATRSEVAQSVGGPRPLLLASVADRSAFGRVEPTEADADQVWRAVDELRRDLNARTTRWGRVRARISLRSLGGYRGSTSRVDRADRGGNGR